MDRRRFIHSSLLLSIGLAGCRSIQTTLLDRHAPTGGTECSDLDGYPITLKVPTHLRITLYENTYLEETKDSTGEIKGWEIINVNGTKLTNITYSTQLIETDKIFLIDHKRPCAGQLKYGVNFSQDQYIDEIRSAATEDTISQSSIAVSRAITLLSGRSLAARGTSDPTRTVADGVFTSMYGADSSTAKRTKPAEVLTGTTELAQVVGEPQTASIPNVLATDIFTIDDPDFELRISDFLRNSLDCQQH